MAKRARRLGLAWQNALEIARAGRLTAPYGASFETVHEEKSIGCGATRSSSSARSPRRSCWCRR